MPKGIALTIGLNHVDTTHYSGWNGNLNACEADAIDMADIAKSKKFSTKILITEEATRSNVTDEILRAAQSLKAGDIFMLACSCCGGKLPDLIHLSVSGLLDTWCLYDSQLLTFEIRSLLTNFQKGVRVLLFSDSCNSGTVVKLPDDQRNAPEFRFKFMPPDFALRTYRQNQGFYEKIIRDPGLKKALGAIKASVLWIFGCQDNQMSADGDFNGVFTAHILKVWKNGAFRGDYRNFHKSLVSQMPPDQTPNFFRLGVINKKFETQRPFTI
ncbi:MAG TPA: caspase family protein [Candidatus Tectomicrobia bacterium]|nr:caspase family protein [Candidatus Tectomicrobia bacterium]